MGPDFGKNKKMKIIQYGDSQTSAFSFGASFKSLYASIKAYFEGVQMFKRK